MTHVNSIDSPHVRTHGDIAAGMTSYAVDKLVTALRHAPAPVVNSWLTIDAAAPGNRIDADANVNGTHLHVHAVGATLQEAADLMQERLRSRLRRIRRRPAQGPPPPAAAARAAGAGSAAAMLDVRGWTGGGPVPRNRSGGGPAS